MQPKVALITGASSGIGLATAEALARAGYRVALVARRQEALNTVISRLHEQGHQAIALPGDVSDPKQVRTLVEACCETWGPPEVLVNNAGLTEVGKVLDFDPEAWERIFAVNTRAVFLMSQAVLPAMLERRSGHIINIASVAARVGFPGWAAYCASKAAVAAFSRALLEEVRSQGVRVSVLYPGGVATPLWDSFDNQFDRSRMLAPDDVAATVCWVVNQPSGVLVEEVGLGNLAGNQ